MRINDKQLYTVDSCYQIRVVGFQNTLDNMLKAIDRFNTIDTIEGATADSIKSYFMDTHKPLIDMLYTYITQLITLQEAFFKVLILDVDASEASCVDTTVMEKCASDFSDFLDSFKEYTSTLHTIMDGVPHYFDANSYYESISGFESEGAVVGEFENIIKETEAMKSKLESIDEAEATGQIVQLCECREALTALINELMNKEATQPEDHWIGRLEDCETYELATEACAESKEYLASVEGEEDHGKEIEHAHIDYEVGRIGLSWRAVENVIMSELDCYGGVKTIETGIAYCSNPATANIGIAVISVGAIEIACAKFDVFYGSFQYFKASVVGNVNYEYESIKDELFGDDIVFDTGDNLTSSAIAGLDVYNNLDESPVKLKTWQKLVIAGVCSAYDFGVNQVLIPYKVELVENVFGEDSTISKIIEKGEEHTHGRFIDWLVGAK